MRSVHRATFGRCSLILMPGTLVAISLEGPPLAWPGLRSKVSICEGPPFIHRRMQALLRRGLAAAAPARFSNQPESEPPSTPAAESVNQSRRDSMGADMDSP